MDDAPHPPIPQVTASILPLSSVNWETSWLIRMMSKSPTWIALCTGIFAKRQR